VPSWHIKKENFMLLFNSAFIVVEVLILEAKAGLKV
jgi:hypothetical protein